MPKKKLDLNESVQATFKDGSIKVYETLEEAAQETGLTVNSIKSRCSKPGSGSKQKDGITFIWADEHTRRSKTAKKNKSKGSGLELEVVNHLKEIGYTGCVSTRSQNKRMDNDKIDIVDMENILPVNIQTKYTINTPNYHTIRESCSDKSKPFVVIWKKSTTDGSNSPGTIAMVDVDYFYKLLKLDKQEVN